MRKYLFLIFGILPLMVNAGTLVCDNSKVELLAYHGNSKFMLKLESMDSPVFFCNPGSVWQVPGTSYKTSPETCKMLYSTFLAAKMSGTPINRIHFDGDDVPSECNNWGSWKSANIRYFRF